VSDPDVGRLGDQLRWVADDLAATSARMQRAAEFAQAVTYEAGSPDGLVEVVADGRNRVTALTLTAPVSGMEPDELDRILTGALNDALEQARKGSQEALLDALPDRVRRDVEETVDLARQDNQR
jgi:DNA-binding protein YbaB